MTQLHPLVEREVILEDQDGFGLQEEYFHSPQELHRVLRELGFDARRENRPVAVERRLAKPLVRVPQSLARPQAAGSSTTVAAAVLEMGMW